MSPPTRRRGVPVVRHIDLHDECDATVERVKALACAAVYRWCARGIAVEYTEGSLLRKGHRIGWWHLDGDDVWAECLATPLRRAWQEAGL